MKNSFILLLAVKSFVLVAGNDEIKISGTFTCNNYIEDDEEIRVTIMEKDLGTDEDPDDVLVTAGFKFGQWFEMAAEEFEVDGIEPYIIIDHTCNCSNFTGQQYRGNVINIYRGQMHHLLLGTVNVCDYVDVCQFINLGEPGEFYPCNSIVWENQ